MANPLSKMINKFENIASIPNLVKGVLFPSTRYASPKAATAAIKSDIKLGESITGGKSGLLQYMYGSGNSAKLDAMIAGAKRDLEDVFNDDRSLLNYMAGTKYSVPSGSREESIVRRASSLSLGLSGVIDINANMKSDNIYNVFNTYKRINAVVQNKEITDLVYKAHEIYEDTRIPDVGIITLAFSTLYIAIFSSSAILESSYNTYRSLVNRYKPGSKEFADKFEKTIYNNIKFKGYLKDSSKFDAATVFLPMFENPSRLKKYISSLVKNHVSGESAELEPLENVDIISGESALVIGATSFVAAVGGLILAIVMLRRIVLFVKTFKVDVFIEIIDSVDSIRVNIERLERELADIDPKDKDAVKEKEKVIAKQKELCDKLDEFVDEHFDRSLLDAEDEYEDDLELYRQDTSDGDGDNDEDDETPLNDEGSIII